MRSLFGGLAAFLLALLGLLLARENRDLHSRVRQLEKAKVKHDKMERAGAAVRRDRSSISERLRKGRF